nr:uncharacterized protein LOC114823028 [Malus domestica]
MVNILMNAATQPRNASEAVKYTVAASALLVGDFRCLHIDVSSNYQGSRTYLVFTTPDGSILEQAITLSFKGNGQAEASNKTILDEFPDVLWAYRTTKRQATGETLFSLAYGSEMIILPNVVVPSISTVLLNFEQNEKEMATNLYLVEKEREKVITCIAAYRQQLLSNYNKG